MACIQYTRVAVVQWLPLLSVGWSDGQVLKSTSTAGFFFNWQVKQIENEYQEILWEVKVARADIDHITLQMPIGL